MSRQKFTDAPGGDTVLYDVVDESNGYRQGTFFTETIEKHLEIFNNLPNIKCREDDILLTSYPKTGTNWLWEMLVMVIAKSSKVTGDTKHLGMIEGVPAELTEGMQSPRLLNTHLKIKYFPKGVFEKKIKAVLLVRNPKDVAVSFYNHTYGLKPYEYDGKFENYVQMFMRGETDYGSYPEYLREWQTFIRENPDFPVLVLYYEDLKRDCLCEMKKVCTFLEIDANEDLLKQIVDNCNIDKLRQSKTDSMPEEMKQHFLTNILKKDFSIYRKGQVGDWKNWFTVAQNEMFEDWWNKETQTLDMFSFKYT
ncbi:sulfotransferase 1B1-like [Mercenaria mercenaria]|uniref:sulfotransferase 1B1-like n=1 Tax=Mercenaria mercenaria TaxID=6596 RepID=UPI00234F0CCC|nr:sulfotransferase 1B1-like [Mercenaria mercenaria]